MQVSYVAFIQALKQEGSELSLTPLLELATQMGLTVSFLNESCHQNSKNYTALTQTIELPALAKDPKELFSNLAHELGHYIVATDEERKIDNYGLGQSPDDDSSFFWELNVKLQNSRKNLPPSRIATEEEASFAGMIIEMILKQSPNYTYQLHGWDKHSSVNAQKELFQAVGTKVRRFIKTGCL
jgi:hypothetical protein